MANLTNLHNKVDPTKLREAMKQLGSAYGIKDKNSFVQLLLDKSVTDDGTLHADEIEEFTPNEELKELADAIISLQGNGKYGFELVKSIQDFAIGNNNPTGPNEKIAKQLLEEPADGKDNTFISVTKSETMTEGEREQYGFLRDHGVEDILPTMNQNLVEGTDRQSVTVIEFHDPLLNFSNRESSAAQIFLQSLPSIEISRAVPFFDLKAIVKGDPMVENPELDSNLAKDGSFQFGNGISIYKFLSGERIEKDDVVVRELARSIPVEMAVPPPTLGGKAGDKVEPPASQEGMISVAGMEVFTSPQTMVRGDWKHEDLDTTSLNYGPGANPRQIPQEKKILDKFRPLMTIESFDVQVTPATGMLATKSASVKIKLHDKTRLNQVIPFIQPAKLGLCDIQIEWGWSHPEKDPDKNPYGALINAMRCKELYGVMNSSYSFTPEGQVDITLKLFSKGAQRATFELISNSKDGKHPMDLLKDVIMGIRNAVKDLKKAGYTLNEEMGAPDVFGKASSVSGLLGMDEKGIKSITAFIKGMQKKKMNKESKEAWSKLGDGWSEAQSTTKAYHEQLKEGLLKEIKEACGTKKVSNDPYLVNMSETAPKGFGYKGKLFDISPVTHVSLAKLLLQMVAKPILATGQFNEIQMVFYPMNEYAMFARSLNVGQYPINKKKIEQRLFKEIKKTPSITIQRFLNMIKKTFVNFPGDDIYGMASAYSDKPDDDGKFQILEKYTKNEKSKQNFSIKKSEVLSKAYPEPGAEKRFKKPSIQMWVECVQHENHPGISILRLHFFDKACTSYSSYAQLWSSTSSGDIGVIGKYARAKKSADKLDKKIEKAPKKEKEKLEKLKKNRDARVVQHKAHADRQIKIFEKNGLIKPITVMTTEEDPDNPDNPKSVPVTKYQIAGGPDQLRGILAANMPTLKYGTEFSGILNASLSTNSDSTMETIHMQRQGGASGTDDGFDAGLPMTVKPVTLSIDTFGCPYINFGQQFFVDFQTNTTIDDIYAVTGVSHNLTPGEFKSQIKLTPLNKTGQYRNLQDQFDDAVAVSDSIGETSG